MSEPRPKYEMTLADLRRCCPLLTKIEVLGAGKDERLVGRNSEGEIVVRSNGKVSPSNVKHFRDHYQRAVAAGIIKTRETHG